MNIEDQVCSFEQAIILDSYNLPASVFGYDRETEELVYKPDCEDFISAYTVAELGVLLPAELKLKNNKDTWITHFKNFDGGIYCTGYQDSTNIVLLSFCGDIESEARAAALIGLLENKYMKAEDLKL